MDESRFVSKFFRRNLRTSGMAPAWIWLSAMMILAAGSISAQRPQPGYVPQPCGFDLDDDGIVGERIDDCRLCDGFTDDPDGDGVDEDLLYVDAQGGSDVTGTGSPGLPYRTIQHAWDQADGPADGAEDVICFRGTAAEESIQPTVSGVAGVRVVARSGSQARDFQFPSDPTMLVGWDTDGDGCYPPYDDGVTDVGRCGVGADEAVLDGAFLDRAFVLSDGGDGIRYLEMAHFAARDYGFQTASFEDIGFVRFGRGTESSHLYLHDLELDNINRGKALDGNAITFDFFIGEMRFSWLAIVNLAARNVGSYFARGSFGNIDIEGPVRFQNIGYLALGCSRDVCGATGSAATVNGFKLWGTADGLEVIDSVFDANTPAWNPRFTGPTNGVVANNCTRDWTLRNNLFRNWSNAVIVKGAEGFCPVRPTDDVLIDSNRIMVDDASNFATGAFGVILGDDGTSSPNVSIADVTVVNNFFFSQPGWRRVLWSNAGNELAEGPGAVVFAGNTVYGSPTFGGWAFVDLRVGLGTDDLPLAFPLPDFRIEGNVFTGLGAGNADDRLVINVDYQPSRQLIVARNTYDPTATFRWLSAPIVETLAAWQSTSGLDQGSRSCTPLLADPSVGDLHLDVSDSCAQNMGGDLSVHTSVDIDGTPRRPGSGLEAGADELGIFSDGFESGDMAVWSVSRP